MDNFENNFRVNFEDNLMTISGTTLGFNLVFPQLYSLCCAVVAMRMSD